MIGKFEADFEAFYAACRKAETELRRIETGSQKATTSVDALNRSARMDTFAASARQAQKETAGLGSAAGKSATDMTKLASGMREVDSIAKLAGVNIGPYTALVDDLSRFAGASTITLGAFGTAAAVAGAAMGGWALGRKIAEWGDLDKKIGDATARLLGWGDVVAQTAGYKMDLLAKASKDAGYQVTLLVEAEALAALKGAEMAAAQKKADDDIARMTGSATLAMNVQKYTDELDLLKSSGLLPQLALDIQSHAYTQQELADAYKVSTRAIQLYVPEAEKAGKIEIANRDKLMTLTLDWRKAEAAAEEARKKAADDKAKQLSAGIAAELSAHQAKQDMMYQELVAQRDANAATLKHTRDLEDQAWAARRAAAAAMTVTQDYDLSSAEGRARFLKLNPGGSIRVGEEYFQTHSIADAIEAGLVSFYGGGGDIGRGVPGPGGAPLPSAQSGLRGSSGPVIYAPVAVSGVFDPAAKAALSTAVGDGMQRGLSMTRRMTR